jgi:hypothetical protein
MFKEAAFYVSVGRKRMTENDGGMTEGRGEGEKGGLRD